MKLHNLRSKKASGYSTFGCMWEKGRCSSSTEYNCKNSQGEEIAMQSRITAYWPDGSVKWTAHTADAASMGDEITVEPVEHAEAAGRKEEQGIQIQDGEKELLIDTGKLFLRIQKNGEYLFEEVLTEGRKIFGQASPVLILEEPSKLDGNPIRMEKNYKGHIEEIEIEEAGDFFVIVKFTGTHVAASGDRKLPFIIRMHVGKSCGELKFTHTFLYDGDEEKDYLKGLGIRFAAPMTGEIYNRHVKIMNDHGMFHESLVPLMSWRPRIPAELYRRQMSGEELFLEGQDKETVDKVLQATPYWSEYSLCQDSVSHFAIKKKLKEENCCYIDSLHGNRTKGGAAFGSANGSVLLAVRDFWEKYPTGYTLKDMDSDTAEATIWFWSPMAEAMDFRHYANRGYNQVCYEGYDYKGATPDGIACTNECSIAYEPGMIPSDERVEEFCDSINNPPYYVGTPEFYHSMRAFGYWSLPSKNTEMEKWLETQLDRAVEFYKNEVEQRNWYGMFNYGDFMHSYDAERHQWKYDIGGYAWDNTELVPTLWLWLAFMRTGREDIFCLAEKLSRHASEVDVYHMGKYKGLGSRHNVRHWGCPCKEARIAMASHHRYYYYMTGDRRLEDIFEELKDNEMSFLNKDPLGDFYRKEDMVFPSHARSGPDWSSLCSNWMTEWERTNDTKYRDKILVGSEDIKKAPLQLISGPDFEFDPHTLHLRYIGEKTTGGTHLQICMGAPEIWFEMADLLEDEEWKKMIAEYGRFYYLPKEKQQEESKGIIGDREFSLPFMSAAMGAYGAKYLKDEWLGKRTWQILLRTLIGEHDASGFETIFLENQGNQEKLMEIPWISTNFVAQWCLNVIVASDFIREALPETLADAEKMLAEVPEKLFHKA